MVSLHTTAASYGGQVHTTKRVLGEVQELANNWRLTPATLYKKLVPSWIPKPFLLDASLQFAQAVVRGNSYLSLSAPPRHGKSRLSTIAGPIWILENFPEKHVILTTYGADLSTDFGRLVRDTINNNQELLNVRIRKDVARVGHFMTTEGGGMTSVGIGGAITGRGADVLLVDDYIKTIQEAESKTYRDELWNWFTTTALTRVEPGGTVIIIATRWNHDDVIGRLRKHYGDMFTFIVYPAEALKDDPLGRKEGEPLFEERYPKHVLEKRRQILGSHYYGALFQQDPESDNVKRADREWIRIIDDVPPSNSWRYVFVWDFAGTKNGGDYTVGALCAFNTITHDFIVVKMRRFQGSPGTVRKAVLEEAKVYGPTVKIVIEEEPGSSGKHLIHSYQTDSELAGYTIEGSPNTTSKLVRANPVLAAAEAGKVFIIQSEAWNEVFLEEFDDFPDGDNDDQVDVLAIGYNELAGVSTTGATWGRNRGLPEASESAVESALRDIRGYNGAQHLRAYAEAQAKIAAVTPPSRMMAISGDYRSKLRKRTGATSVCWGR